MEGRVSDVRWEPSSSGADCFILLRPSRCREGTYQVSGELSEQVYIGDD